MNRKTKALIIFLVLFALLSVAAKYYKFSITSDYYISTTTECDVEIESCFVWDCDIEEDEDCDHTPYKYIYKHAGSVPSCNPFVSEECSELTCEGDEDCEVTECSEDEIAEDEICYAEWEFNI